MMTQADILAKNDETYADVTVPASTRAQNLAYDNPGSQLDEVNETASNATQRIPKPTNFGDNQFGSLNAFDLNEQSPIRPSKYFASDSAINASKGLRYIIIGGMVFCLSITVALLIQISLGTVQVPYRIGIVTQEKVCSDIGANMVRKGGNSIDAFIASSLCLSVVNPFVAGIGAGGYLLVRDHKHEKNLALNCFFKSSAKLDLNDYKTSPVDGKKSVAVPGELKCLQMVYHKYARFYWKTLTEPAISLAKNGFKVSKLLADNLKKLDLNDIKSNPILSEMYLDENGSLVTEGSTIKNVRLGNTLELFSKKENVFYIENGEIGSDLVDELEENNVEHITEKDLSSYTAKEEVPITANYNDFVLLASPFPSNGPILKFIIDLMKTVSIKASDFKEWNIYSLILQATKLGYDMSKYVADPVYDMKQTEVFNEKLTVAQSYFSSLINDGNATFPLDKEEQLNDELNINFISVNDHNDMMVSYVGTLGSIWGSKFITKRGYFLNNGLNLFTYTASAEPDSESSNLFYTNKQPRALMTPILTYNKKNPCIRRFSIGYSHRHHPKGDDYALTELIQVILKLFTDFSLYENSISDKRLQYSTNDQACFENGFDAKIQDKLIKEANFKPTNSCMYHSIDLIMKKDHIVYGQADVTRSQDSLVLFN